MPLTSKTFSQLIDFTRTSAATYVDQLGRIVPTPVSLNEYTFTQEFDNVAWSRNSSTLTANNALAPDGSMTADTFTAQAGTALRPEMTQVVSTVSGGLYTISYNVRPVTHSFIQIIINAQVAEWVNFTLSGAGTATANGPCAASIVLDPLTGWYRISMTYIAGGTDRRPVLCMIPSAAAGRAATFNPVGTEVIRVWGAQLEQTPDANLTLGSELNSAAVPFTVFRDGSTNTPSPTLMNTVSGKLYRVQLNISVNTSTQTSTLRINGGGTSVGFPLGATGSVIMYLTAASSGVLTVQGDAAGVNFTVTSASIREVTAASPSTYTRNFGGRFPPRFDYDPVTLAPRGLLIEEQRTNLLVRSEEFDNAAWTKHRATVTANAALSPDGTVDADKLVEDSTASNTHACSQGFSGTSGTSYTLSIYAKAAERSWVALQFTSNIFADALARTAFINLSTGAVGTTSGSPTITVANARDGWWRITMTVAATATSASAAVFVYACTADNAASYTGNGTSGIFVWGAQLEAGAFATSYIPTVASQVTRTADTAAITGANFSPWYNPVEGTLLVEASSFVNTAAAVNLAASLGSINNRNFTFLYNGAWGGSTVTGGTQVSDLQTAGTYTRNVPAKVAYAYRANDFAASVNGAAANTDAMGAVPAADTLLIGSGVNNPINGHIRSIRYYPTRLTNAQLQALTA
jgi:hypothetical protein